MFISFLIPYEDAAMKELFQLLAKYNTQTNAETMGILEKITIGQ